MSNRNVRDRSHVPKLSTFAGALAAMLLALSATGAHALNTFSPPAGWIGVRVIVGDDFAGRPWLVYQQNTSGGGACSWHILGFDDALDDDTLVHGTAGADELYIPSSYDWEGCGEVLTDPGDMGGKAFEVRLGAGSDKAWVNANPFGWYNMGEGTAQGDKFLGDGGRAVGSNGADTLIMVSGTAARMYGLNGGDKLCTMFGPIKTMDGGGLGSDQDRSYGTATYIVDIESPGSLTSSWCFTQANSVIGYFLD